MYPSRETGIDRDIITSIATTYLDGFSTGSASETTGPLAELSPQDSFVGWTLRTASANRIRWVSAGRFNLTLSPAPNGSITLSCNAPEADRTAWYRKGRSIYAGPDDALTPTEHGTATVSGEVTEIRTRHGRGNQSIRFENVYGTYVVDDYDPDRYGERIAEGKERSLHVKKDLNPGGAVNFIGLNTEGEPADVAIEPKEEDR